jgi:hypothetical protein
MGKTQGTQAEVDTWWEGREAIEAGYPGSDRGPRGFLRLRRALGQHVYRLSDSVGGGGEACAVHGRRAKGNILITNPLTLRRHKVAVCGRASCARAWREWSDLGNAAYVRARVDWDKQHPEAAAARLVDGIPAQYPSVSRSTLRAFVESDLEDATVEEGSSATTLNGTIDRLGFGDKVYAEIRSGQTVLRRIRERP